MTQAQYHEDHGAIENAPLVELVDVHAAYGTIEVLHGINLSVPQGSVVALLGPNGAGKSTILKVVSGLLPPTSGEVRLAGREAESPTPRRFARSAHTPRWMTGPPRSCLPTGRT